MVTDFELAWSRLLELIATKSQHGRDALLRQAVTIAAESRVPSGELSRLLRLYGVEVERARAASTETSQYREDSAAFAAGRGSVADAESPGVIEPEEVHDVIRNGGAGALAA